MLLRIASIIAPVLLMTLAGWLYARCRPETDMGAVNRLNVDLLSPLLVFSAMTARDFSITGHGALLLAVLLITFGSGGIAWLVAKIAGYKPIPFSAPQMFTNTGNMGLPLWLFAFGERYFPAAVAVFVLTNLLNFTYGIWLFNRKAGFAALLNVPMVWALVAGLAVKLAGITLPEVLAAPIRMTGQAAIPLMLLALGVRMAQFKITRWGCGLLAGALCPLSGLLVCALLIRFMPLSTAETGILWVYAALPPAVINYLFAEQYRQEPDTVAAIVVAGTLLSLVFMPLALYLAL